MWLVFGIEPVQLLTAYRYTIFLPFDALIALKVGISRVEIVPPFWRHEFHALIEPFLSHFCLFEVMTFALVSASLISLDFWIS